MRHRLRNCAWLLATLAILAPAPALASHELGCSGRVLRAVAGTAKRWLRCEARAAKRGTPVDEQCRERALARWRATLLQLAEEDGACAALAARAGLERRLRDLVEAQLPAPGPASRCGARRAGALGQHTARHARTLARALEKNSGRLLARAMDRADRSLARRTARAERAGDCLGEDRTPEFLAASKRFALSWTRSVARCRAIRTSVFLDRLEGASAALFEQARATGRTELRDAYECRAARFRFSAASLVDPALPDEPMLLVQRPAGAGALVLPGDDGHVLLGPAGGVAFSRDGLVATGADGHSSPGPAPDPSCPLLGGGAPDVACLAEAVAADPDVFSCGVAGSVAAEGATPYLCAAVAALALDARLASCVEPAPCVPGGGDAVCATAGLCSPLGYCAPADAAADSEGAFCDDALGSPHCLGADTLATRRCRGGLCGYDLGACVSGSCAGDPGAADCDLYCGNGAVDDTQGEQCDPALAAPDPDGPEPACDASECDALDCRCPAAPAFVATLGERTVGIEVRGIFVVDGTPVGCEDLRAGTKPGVGSASVAERASCPGLPRGTLSPVAEATGRAGFADGEEPREGVSPFSGRVRAAAEGTMAQGGAANGSAVASFETTFQVLRPSCLVLDLDARTSGSAFTVFQLADDVLDIPIASHLGAARGKRDLLLDVGRGTYTLAALATAVFGSTGGNPDVSGEIRFELDFHEGSCAGL